MFFLPDSGFFDTQLIVWNIFFILNLKLGVLIYLLKFGGMSQGWIKYIHNIVTHATLATYCDGKMLSVRKSFAEKRQAMKILVFHYFPQMRTGSIPISFLGGSSKRNYAWPIFVWMLCWKKLCQRGFWVFTCLFKIPTGGIQITFFWRKLWAKLRHDDFYWKMLPFKKIVSQWYFSCFDFSPKVQHQTFQYRFLHELPE